MRWLHLILALAGALVELLGPLFAVPVDGRREGRHA